LSAQPRRLTPTEQAERGDSLYKERNFCSFVVGQLSLEEIQNLNRIIRALTAREARQVLAYADALVESRDFGASSEG